LYAIPELKDVANNGGDRINKKAQMLFQKLADSIPGGQGLVKEEVGKMSRSPKKAAGGGAGHGAKRDSGSPSKKRKVKQDVKEEVSEDGELSS
jgi:hypothetical protein